MVLHWCPDGSPMVVHYANKRKIQEASYSTLHSIFNHCGFVKLQHTLEHVCGLTLPADGIKDCFCETCAMAKSEAQRPQQEGFSKPCGPSWLEFLMLVSTMMTISTYHPVQITLLIALASRSPQMVSPTEDTICIVLMFPSYGLLK